MIVQGSTHIYTATIMLEEHQCSRGQGERCRGSKSPICVCACGGWNHGNQAARRKAVAEELDAKLVDHPRAQFHKDTAGYYLDDDES